MSRYKYSNLKEIVCNGEYNFYGIIYDSNFPVLDEKDGQYHCIIRIIDPEINCLTNPNNYDNFFYIIVKSSEKENLPYIHSVGEIIRVHRGNFVNFL